MKSAFFIMQLWQTGNVGSNNIKKLKANPKEGYESYEDAKAGMLKLWAEDNWDLKKGGYDFAIMELFR